LKARSINERAFFIYGCEWAMVNDICEWSMVNGQYMKSQYSLVSIHIEHTNFYISD